MKTDIPNPGSKATLYPLCGDTVVMLHNPNPAHRSPMALWISIDGLKICPTAACSRPNPATARKAA